MPLRRARARGTQHWDGRGAALLKTRFCAARWFVLPLLPAYTYRSSRSCLRFRGYALLVGAFWTWRATRAHCVHTCRYPACCGRADALPARGMRTGVCATASAYAAPRRAARWFACLYRTPPAPYARAGARAPRRLLPQRQRMRSASPAPYNTFFQNLLLYLLPTIFAPCATCYALGAACHCSYYTPPSIPIPISSSSLSLSHHPLILV